MRFWSTVDRHCPTCHGSGMATESRWEEGECFVLTMVCHCVEYHHDKEMKETLRALTSATRQTRVNSTRK